MAGQSHCKGEGWRAAGVRFGGADGLWGCVVESGCASMAAVRKEITCEVGRCCLRRYLLCAASDPTAAVWRPPVQVAVASDHT